MPTVRDAFAALLTAERERAGLSQEQLADLAGLDRSTIGALERAMASPKLETVISLASALKIDTCDLVPPVRRRRTGGGAAVFEWVDE